MFNLVAIAIYGLFVCLCAVAGTCTQGDAGRFFVSLMYGLPASIYIAYRVIRHNSGSVQQQLTAWAAFFLAIFVCDSWGELVIQTTILGHNLCGQDFDVYNTRPYLLERAIPAIHVISVSFIFIAALKKLKANSSKSA